MCMCSYYMIVDKLPLGKYEVQVMRQYMLAVEDYLGIGSLFAPVISELAHISQIE